MLNRPARPSSREAVNETDSLDSVREQLRIFCADRLGTPQGGVAIRDLERSAEGRSRENWTFELLYTHDGESICEALIVRVDPAGGLVDTSRAREFALLNALDGTGLPVPKVRWLDSEGCWFSRPALVMRREPGVCDYYLLSGDRPVANRLAIAQKLCELLVHVHNVDWLKTGLAPILDGPGQNPSVSELRHWEGVLRRDQREDYPLLDVVTAWLYANAQPPEKTVLVHGDFKPGNVLFVGDEISALLDWELSHLGDPLEDLGWMTQPLRRREQFVAGMWEEEEIVDFYSSKTGASVSRPRLKWWQVFATFRTAVMQVSGRRAFLEGRTEKAFAPTQKVFRALTELLGVDGVSA